LAELLYTSSVPNMKIVLGWSLIVVLGLALSVNALFMLVSPKAWFRLPRWIGAQGSLTEEKYASGWGGIQVRLMGGIWLGFIGWVLYHSLIRQPLPKEKELVLMLSIIGWSVVAIVAVHLSINAAFMLASPRAWFRLPSWLRAQVPLSEQKYTNGLGSILVRLTGAALLAVLSWVLYGSLIRGWLANP
jgi:hypothetical protein